MILLYRIEDAEHEMIGILLKHGFNCPRPIPNVDGGDKSIETIAGRSSFDSNQPGYADSLINSLENQLKLMHDSH